MRSMSFFITTDQVRRSAAAVKNHAPLPVDFKDLTRRVGWANLVPGERFRACVKCQGLKKGEHVEVLTILKCVSNTPEPLTAIEHRGYRSGRWEVAREGFPKMSEQEFVAMFCEEMDIDRWDNVNRIEFIYVEES